LEHFGAEVCYISELGACDVRAPRPRDDSRVESRRAEVWGIVTHVCTLYLVDLGIDLGALGALGVQTVASFARSMCADQIKKSARATSW
jgi:hypothetical protein